MNQEQPTPPNELRPWYYQYWFLYPMIVFWPLWPVLILRSPWHNNLISGAVAWAMLFMGGYLIGWRQLYQNRELNDFTITLIIPGLFLTVVTQILWFWDKKKVRQAAQQEKPPTAPAQPRRARNRRRGSRSGRSSRGRG